MAIKADTKASRGRRAAALTLAAGAGAAGALVAQARRNRAKVLADPAYAKLNAPLEGRPLEVRSADGTRLNARVFGADDAPTIVLGHGWTCALRFWTLQIQELARDHRVVAWDLRGHGQSDPPASNDYTIEALADDLDAVLAAALREGERAVVAGHSLGGMTLVAWAGEHPEQVSERLAAAALLNTGMGGLVAESLVIRSPFAVEATRDALGRAILSATGPLPPFPNPITHEAVRYIALGRTASPATVEFTERMVLECGPSARAGCGATISKLDLQHHLERLTVPTLVVTGEHDRLTPPVHGRRMVEALPDATYLELPGGHMSPLEEPAKINAALRELAGAHLAGAAGAAGAAEVAG